MLNFCNIVSSLARYFATLWQVQSDLWGHAVAQLVKALNSERDKQSTMDPRVTTDLTTNNLGYDQNFSFDLRPKS
jgi:hypothetical protein